MTAFSRLTTLFRINPRRSKALSPPAVSSASTLDPTEAETITPSNLQVNHEARTALELFQHNRNLPINRLPPEVLQVVFVWLPVQGFHDGHYARLFCFRTVCKYWMEVIDSTPELWNMISSWLHPKLQARIIQNSRNQLLAVKYDEHFWRENSDARRKMAAFESLMKPSASRWQALEYRQVYSSDSDVRILSLPMHNLERIKIEGPTTRNGQHPTLDAPKLSHVEVHQYSLNWRSLSGLQVLILETYPTFNELMIILQASPGLRCLSMIQKWIRIGVERPPDHYPSKICLPQLRTLRIEGALTDSSSILLDWIQAPSLETLNVTAAQSNDVEDYNQLCEAAGRHIGTFPLPRNDNQAQVFIMVQDRMVMFGVAGRRVTIWNRTWTRVNGTQAKLACIASAMRHLDNRIREEVKTLDISYRDGKRIDECLRMVHSLFPQIDQIIVLDGGTSETDVGVMFEHLCLPSQLGSAEEWLLPKLTKLQLDLSRSLRTDWGSRIAEFVRRRRAAEQTEDITELRISVGPRAVSPAAVKLLHRFGVLVDLTVVRGVYQS